MIFTLPFNTLTHPHTPTPSHTTHANSLPLSPAPVGRPLTTSMHAVLWVPGWLVDSDFGEGGCVSKDLWAGAVGECPWGEHYSVVWERPHLLEWGDALQSFLTSKMASEVGRREREWEGREKWG